MTAATPDYVTPVTGWRSWLVVPGDGEARLASVSVGHEALWPIGEPLRASCRATGVLAHPSPWRHCRCGIHAARTPVEAAFYVELPQRARTVMAIGLVSLWGSVIEAEGGWRVSRAYPERLYLPCRQPSDEARLWAIAADLVDAYGVPAEVLHCPYGGVVGTLAPACAELSGAETPFNAAYEERP